LEGIPVGTHCILELYGCPFELLNDAEFIRRSLRRASKQGLSTLLGLRSHKFEPQGVTAVALLAESHISIHTWPETGYAAVDIFTCGETAQPQLACDFMVENFAAREHAMCILPRGAGLSETTPSWTRETTTGAELCPAQS
jgi:S-adenosylmethionine decarboxylase